VVKAEWEDLLHRETEDFRCLIVICRFFMLWPLAPKGGTCPSGREVGGRGLLQSTTNPECSPASPIRVDFPRCPRDPHRALREKLLIWADRELNLDRIHRDHCGHPAGRLK
jgi:hypothetical protein